MKTNEVEYAADLKKKIAFIRLPDKTEIVFRGGKGKVYGITLRLPKAKWKKLFSLQDKWDSKMYGIKFDKRECKLILLGLEKIEEKWRESE